MRPYRCTYGFFQSRPASSFRTRWVDVTRRHTADPNFEEGFDPYKLLRRLKTPLGVIGSVETHFLLQKLYEIEFSLFNHTDPVAVATDPLAVIRAKPEECYSTSSHLWDIAERYARAKINKRFNLNFIEYCNLPMPDAALLDKMAFEVMGNLELQESKKENQLFAKASAPNP